MSVGEINMSTKPISLCLVHMGKKGLELVRTYPEILPDNVLNEIVLKSMPLGAKAGDFTTNTVGDCTVSGYIFPLIGDDRQGIGSIVAVFEHSKYNQDLVKNILAYTTKELQLNSINDKSTISTILPNLFKGFNDGQLKIKISSVVTLEFDFSEEHNNEDNSKNQINSLKNEMW